MVQFDPLKFEVDSQNLSDLLLNSIQKPSLIQLSTTLKLIDTGVLSEGVSAINTPPFWSGFRDFPRLKENSRMVVSRARAQIGRALPGYSPCKECHSLKMTKNAASTPRVVRVYK